MFKKSLNMIYSNKNTFFSTLSVINQSVKSKKQTSVAPIGTVDDDREIQRGYDIFKELGEHQSITIQSLRDSMASRGVTNREFQDKIFFMLLQNRSGIQFRFGELVSEMLFKETGLFFGTTDGYQLDLEVNGPSDVTLTIKNKLTEKDPWDASIVTTAFETTVRINIKPDMVSISDFEVEQKGSTQNAGQAFKFLEDNHQNILERLLSYIKHALGYDAELRIEDSNDSTVGIQP